MKHMALIGTGSIGLMLGAFLARSGYDITLISQFRADVAETINREGLIVTSGADTWKQPVRAVFWQDIPKREQYDVLFLTGKSNDTEDALDKMLPNLAPGGFVTSLQNGINDDVIAARAGADRVIPCVCFAGGQCPKTNHVMTHDGYFIIGEPSGERTDRLLELEQMLASVKRVEVTEQIRAARWKKLSEVCLTVPVATVSGQPLFSGFENRIVQRVFAGLAQEVMAVERGLGILPEPIMGLAEAEWGRLAGSEVPELSRKFLAAMERPVPPGGEANGPYMVPEDAYTQDIRKGRPLEVWFTNGFVLEQAKKLGIETPVNEKLCQMIRELEAGSRKAAMKNLEELAAENVKTA